jgi:hypothetical protein
MAPGNNDDLRLRRLREKAEELRFGAANMRLPSARASLLKMAAAYDDLAKMLSPLARSLSRREFSQREQAESRNC